eukprot:CAMPEP_0198687866 /NCGR_PEP_ID=MMETSP1468-20131203/79496_1 /TAXON_ID=1461545 /ORGANISM="Mantoniella sp, Strain CCMP1436" /LENGTH=61 /DNA_ID=CAMNT_0044436507 /DNA_START=169 /DNA_END=354 /DNA_ORIENTATION=-
MRSSGRSWCGSLAVGVRQLRMRRGDAGGAGAGRGAARRQVERAAGRRPRHHPSSERRQQKQ